ncbi:MAG: hypothetical protein COZ27_00200 [Candidatus Moranbacteria bacterium CG_4_10_14_3_um_filter_41_65]|nr:MAG: hypothetical protein COX32_01735 [Candidatus Moranbacteria bacterium CG23_combo_of_CG06-09_8_20_14_all_41_28]PIV86445.1 MAG: hypothetical protein COW50_01365 [Candidatus Moranbacteria bacterium CG17_big_fil_post_rev_8_21_14_2_50_41_107]PIW94129.1 MAG: hypothetical protein COZ86_02695 [Candidatus Moranbacteria bacterium CG_4_8_14_3_um_filter_41_13]PIX91925.1 MAG: hypothetical protein COZ27_00200 [Candidatus Moranbacteria bacterium CG_4_10_14_3_um_filter_41_65]HCJ45326.1 hypothetical prot
MYTVPIHKNTPMEQEEIDKRVKAVEEAYKDFLHRIEESSKEEEKIIAEFERVLTKARMEEIKNSLDTL